jgi:hypothetical protein
LGDDNATFNCAGNTTLCPIDGDICGDLAKGNDILYNMTLVPPCQYGEAGCNMSDSRIRVPCVTSPVSLLLIYKIVVYFFFGAFLYAINKRVNALV